MMITPAMPSDFDAVKEITHQTIRAVYPHYYPAGAVQYFLRHHSDEAIRQDLACGAVYLCRDAAQNAVGTVTVTENEIGRLFVLQQYQGMGYGRALLDFAERVIAGRFHEIVLSASLSAKGIYLKRGYREISYHQIQTDGGDLLCYDLMQKKLIHDKTEDERVC